MASEPECTCEATGVVHPWGAELIPNSECYYHGVNGVNVVHIHPSAEAQAARDVKLHDRFIGPYAAAVEAVKKADKTPYDLTRRQLQMLMALFTGDNHKKIARDNGLELSTVRSHLHSAYVKMGVTSDIGAVLKWAYEQGLPAQPDSGAGVEADEDDG